MPILLMNPNSSAETTATMCALAARVLPAPPVGWTAPSGPGLLTTPETLAAAAVQIETAALADVPDAVIVAAFGDPGAEGLARRLPCPVVGIGAASARAAAATGGPFAVATTTPVLARQIDTLMRAHAGRAPYVGSFFAEGPAESLMADRDRLDAALLGAIEAAQSAGAAAVVIGGGPLGAAAERLRPLSAVPLFNPVLCAAAEVAPFSKG